MVRVAFSPRSRHVIPLGWVWFAHILVNVESAGADGDLRIFVVDDENLRRLRAGELFTHYGPAGLTATGVFKRTINLPRAASWHLVIENMSSTTPTVAAFGYEAI
jgi:hypothetical protein